MATRLYPLNQTAPYTPATIRGTWNDTASLVTKKLGTVKFTGDANANVSKAETSTTNLYSVGLLRFVSDALPTARTLTASDTFTICMGCYESSSSANMFPKITIYVTVGDSDTVRGYLKQDWVGATEWTTTAGYRSTGAIALAGTVAAQVGDRIVVVLGYSAANTSATSYAGQMWYGAGAAMADGVAAATTHTTTAGWIEFSGNNMFAQSQPASLPMNLLSDVGTVQEDFSNAADWTVANGSAADNTTEFRTGTQSVKITGTTATDCTATKTVNWDLSGNFHRLQLWYYLHNPAADYPAGVQFYLSSTTGFTKSYWQEAYNTYFRQGWNVLTFDQSDLINAGTDSWASARIRLRVEFTSATGKAAAISFDSLTINQIAVPAVMLYFDDATTTQYTVCFPYMQSYGIKGTIFCDTSQIDQAGSLTSAQLAAVDAAGWTVGNHTNSASGLGGQTEAAQEAQILGGKTALTALGLTKGVNYVAYPSGTFDLNTDIAMANLGMLFGRTTEPSDGSGEIRQALPWGDWYHVPTRASTALTLATAKTAVDKAIVDGYIQPIHFHKVGAGDWTTADFQSLIDYLALKGVACITADDFYQLSQGPLGGTTLTVADADHAHSVDSPTLTQAYSLTVADAGHAHTAETPALTQVHSLTVADSGHVHAAENVTLASDVALTVADSNHAHTAEAIPTLFSDLDEIQRSAGGEDSYATVQHLTADVDTWDDAGPFTGGTTYFYRGRHWTGTEAGDWSASASVTFAGAIDLVVADVAHAHTADAPTLTQAHSLTVADVAHASATESPVLTQAHLLAVVDSSHVHTVDAPALTQAHSLAVADASHGHSAESPVLTQTYVWYVSRNGNNGSGGSWANAWNELDQIDWASVQPGDRILIDGGTSVCSSPFNALSTTPFDFSSPKPGQTGGGGMLYNTTLTIGKSGTTAAPITIQRATESGHNGTAVFFGGRLSSLPACTQSSYTNQTSGNVLAESIRVNAYHDVVIDGMDRSGIVIYGAEAGVNIHSTSAAFVTLRNMEIFDNGVALHTVGFGWYSDNPGIWMVGHDLTFDRMLVHDNGQDAIQDGTKNGVGQYNVTITDSWLYCSRENPYQPGYGFNTGWGEIGTHPDGLQTWDGGTQTGLTVRNTVFGPYLGQGFYPADSGTPAKWNNVTLDNLLFMNILYDSINADGNSTTNWQMQHITSYKWGAAPDGINGAHLDMIRGSGHTLTDSIFVNAANDTGLTGVTGSGNFYHNTDPVPGGTNADPQFVAVLATGTPHFSDLLAVDLTPQNGACAGKGSTLHTLQDILDQIDTLNLTNHLIIADVAHGHSAEAVTLTQAHTLSVADSSHVHSADAPTLTQAQVLTVAPSDHAHSVEAPVLTQAHTLTVDDSSHVHTAANVTLGAADTLVVEDSSHASSVESPTLTQAHNLTVSDSSHLHSAETPTLVQAFTLTVADSGHAHTAASPILTQAHVLTVADSGHAHSAESPALVQAFTLVVADVAHSHSVDAPTLAQAHTLTVAASTHVHQADNVTLGTADMLAVADVTHAHSAASPTLTQLHNLIIADASHAHSADAVLLTQAHSLAVAGSAHAHTSENVTLSYGTTLTVADVAHGHSVEAVTLTQNHVLTVAAATHAHTAASIALTQWHALLVADLAHVHTADSPSLGQDHVLTVANVSHTLTLDGVVVVEGSAIVPFRVFVVQARQLAFVVAARPTTFSVPARNLTFTVVKR